MRSVTSIPRRLGDALRAHPDRSILGALLLLGAIARLAFLFRAPAFFIGGDSQTYLLPAYELARDGNWDLGFRRPPAYPLFLAGVIALLGEDTRAISFAQHLLGLATIAATYTLGRAAANRAVGAVASLGAAIAGPLLVYEHYIMSEALFTLIVTLLGWCILASRRRGTVQLALVTGLLLGVGWLTRPAALLLLPVALLALIGPFRTRRSVSLGALVVLGAVVVVAPWSLSLQVRHGTGSAIGLGNNLLWRVTRNDLPLVNARDSWPSRGSDDLAAARRYAFSRAIQKDLPDDIADALEQRFGFTEIQSDRILVDVALYIIRNRPLLFLQTTGSLSVELFMGDQQHLGGQGKEGGVDRYTNPQEKYQSWWNARVRHIPQPPLPSEAAEFSRARGIVDIFQPYQMSGALLALCLAGVVSGLIRRDHRAALLLGAAVTAGLLGAAALSGSTPRFRYPFDPMIWALAAMGGLALISAARAAVAKLRERPVASPSISSNPGVSTHFTAAPAAPPPVSRGD